MFSKVPAYSKCLIEQIYKMYICDQIYTYILCIDIQNVFVTRNVSLGYFSSSQFSVFIFHPVVTSPYRTRIQEGHLQSVSIKKECGSLIFQKHLRKKQIVCPLFQSLWRDYQPFGASIIVNNPMLSYFVCYQILMEYTVKVNSLKCSQIKCCSFFTTLFGTIFRI